MCNRPKSRGFISCLVTGSVITLILVVSSTARWRAMCERDCVRATGQLECEPTRPKAELFDEEGLKHFATSVDVQVIGKILNYRYRKQANKFGNWDNRDFLALERFGIHLSPVHFYSALPEFSQRSDAFYNEVFDMPGLKLDAVAQGEFANSVVNGACVDEFHNFPQSEVASRVYEWHHSLGFMDKRDSLFLYCFVRNTSPEKIIEIGGGTSTSLMAAAVRANKRDGISIDLRSIEPFPVGALSRYVDGESEFPGLNELISQPLEKVDKKFFQTLTKGDVLFIDSSHVFREGGDVELELMHIIPQLRSGVIIHIHDILLPRRYTKDMALNSRFYNEQYFLWAFLAFNSEFEILWMPSWLAENHADKFPQAFEKYATLSSPDSFWFRRV